jgi:hypothetical protein
MAVVVVVSMVGVGGGVRGGGVGGGVRGVAAVVALRCYYYECGEGSKDPVSPPCPTNLDFLTVLLNSTPPIRSNPR